MCVSPPPPPPQQYLCRFTEETVGGTCTGLVRVRSGKETDLQLAVAIAGPVTVAVDARHTGFQVEMFLQWL